MLFRSIIKDLQEKAVKGIVEGNWTPQDAESIMQRLAKLGGMSAAEQVYNRIEKEEVSTKIPYDKQLELKLQRANPERYIELLRQFRKESRRE